MAYYIKYGDKYLFDPRYDEYYLSDVELDTEENSCGYLDFSIYKTHPMYDKIYEFDYRNPVSVYENDVLLFQGFIYEISENFQLEHQVRCKGVLDYLEQAVVRPVSSYNRSWSSYVPPSYEAWFEYLIDIYNSQLGHMNKDKKFVLGINQGAIVDELYTFPDIEFDDYPTVMDIISEIFIGNDGVGGYIKVRYENSIRYIDYLYEWKETNSQILDFGVNLRDYSNTNKSESVISYVIPTGAKLKDTDYEYDDGYYEKTESTPYRDVDYYTRDLEYVEKDGYELTNDDFKNQSNDTYWIYEKSYESSGTPTYSKTRDSYPRDDKTYYINYKNRYKYSQVDITSFASGTTYYRYDPNKDMSDVLLTITSLTDGPDEINPDYKKYNDMVYSQYMVNLIGYKVAHVANTNIKTIPELYESAISYLDNYSFSSQSIEIKAVDMHLINPNLKPLAIGEYVRVRSKPHGLDKFFICKNITLDLNDPSQSTYILGLKYDTLTGEQTKQLAYLNRITNKQIDATNKLTEAEKRRANSTSVKDLTAVSAEQDAAITSLFEMIVGG